MENKKNEDFKKQVLTLLKGKNPELYEKYKDNLEFVDGKLIPKESEGVDFLELELVMRSIDQDLNLPKK